MKRLYMLFIPYFFAVNLYAVEESLYEIFKGRPEIKVALEDVINETTIPAVKAEVFRNVFKETLEKRHGIKFIYSKDRIDADAVIIVRIVNYIFTEKAMPIFFSSATLVGDTLSPKSSGRLTVDYEVRRPADDKVLLSYKNFTTEERRPQETMQGERGFIHSVSKSVNRFLYKAFYKPKAR